MAQLFNIKIPAMGQYPGGALLVSEPAPTVYLLTISYAPDNRLVAPVCGAMLEALDILEARYPMGVVITTSGIPKFFSNGLDLQHAVSTGRDYWVNYLYKLWARIATYPMPTIALLPGHAFAGGLMLAMYHDYRIMNPSRGFICLNELDFGVPLKPQMSHIFREKLSFSAYRSLALEAKRVPGPEALALGIVDVLGGLNEALELVATRKLTEKGKTGVYGLMKREMNRNLLDMLTPAGYDKEEAREAKLNAEMEKEYNARGLQAPKSRL
ncbi:Enoyl-CoA hydratase domain-containing protein 2 mitochondrial [Ceratocystis platani]|uniref:Enoyl-CoA hydratase domain-containing protein 2 mitochondrial n=1 Tax=Ceratocystis fimbriata f. sp. platani TaxID=88771 RepID=A0A0F8D144_CERFI|nr:Enoyl-CoA hydratase domain-containing protein 2 mitochondrial [Ceratocystis platani]